MFSLFGACVGCARDATAGRKKITLLLLGLDNSGKSTVSACLQNDSTEDITPTLGFANGSARMSGCDVTLLDLGGNFRIRDIWDNYYAESHGVVFVVDASDTEKLDESKQVLVNIIHDSRITGKPLLIFANKQDRDGAMSDMELYRFFGLEQIAQGKIDQCRVVSCTALRNHHPGNKVDRRIRTGTKWLLRCIKGNWEYLSEKVTQEYGAQKEAEERERQERKERVRRIREERERKAKEEGTGDDDGADQEVVPVDPFKPIETVVAEIEVHDLEHESLLQSTPDPVTTLSSANQPDGPASETITDQPDGPASERIATRSDKPSSDKTASKSDESITVVTSVAPIVKSDVEPSSKDVVPARPESNTAHSSGSSVNGVRLEPLDVKLIKENNAKRKKKAGLWSKRNKVAPVSGEQGAKSGFEGETRRHSCGLIKLKSSRENLIEGEDTRTLTSNNTVSEDNILTKLDDQPADMNEVPAISVQSPGLGDTHFLP